jgi:hypothetical protein
MLWSCSADRDYGRSLQSLPLANPDSEPRFVFSRRIASLAARINAQKVLRFSVIAADLIPLTRALRVSGGGPFGRPVRR